MKTFLITLSLLLTTFNWHQPSTEINKEVTVNGYTYLYGEINREGLKSGSYKGWFEAGYKNYQPNADIVAACTEDMLQGVTVKLLMATWCGDSRRNVPVFYKVMDELGFDEDKLQAWALNTRKQGPNNEQLRYKATRVPTMIFYRDDVEIGRFVERLKPGQRLENVITSILNN